IFFFSQSFSYFSFYFFLYLFSSEFFIDFLMNNHPACSRTLLSCRSVPTTNCCFNCFIKVSVICYNERVLSTHFYLVFCSASNSSFSYSLTCFIRSSK